MEDESEKLKKYLKEELKDLRELERNNKLTDEGRGMLIIIKAIFQHMNWKIDDTEVL